MGNDLIIKSGSKSLYSSKLDHLVGNGAILGTSGLAVGVAGKAASLFCKNNSVTQQALKTISSYGIFAGVLGFAALGTAYFLWNSVTDEDIANQEAASVRNKGNEETPLLNFIQSAKVSWLKVKKDIQQSIYSLLGWRE